MKIEIVETERFINYFIWEKNDNCISGYSRNENSFTIFKKDYCWINGNRMKKFFKKKALNLKNQIEWEKFNHQEPLQLELIEICKKLEND